MSMMTWKEAQKEKFHGMQSVQQQERVMIWRLYLVYAKKIAGWQQHCTT